MKARQLGFWATSAAAGLALWFSIAFGLYQPVLHAPWPGLQAYAEAFEATPFLAWVIPVFADPIFPLPLVITLIIALANAAVLVGALVLAAICFRRSCRTPLRNAPSS